MFIFAPLGVAILLLILLALASALALTLSAAFATLVGGSILITLRIQQKSPFWPSLIATELFWSGLGALVGSWGLYWGTSQLWANIIGPFVAWFAGYFLLGTVGFSLALLGFLLRRRHELPMVWIGLKHQFHRLSQKAQSITNIRPSVYAPKI